MHDEGAGAAPDAVDRTLHALPSLASVPATEHAAQHSVLRRTTARPCPGVPGNRIFRGHVQGAAAKRCAADQGRCRVPRRQPLPINLEVKAAIDQLSPATLRQLARFAQRGVRQLARAGVPIASDEHDQLVHDAITDTLSLVVVWDRRIQMEMHLYNVIRWRISNGIRRANARGSVSLEAIDPENDVAMASRDSEPETSLSRAQVTQRVYQVARDRAAGDPEVVSMLDAYHAEVSERRAVMAWTGMTLAEVVNARRRLDRLLAGLPAELRLAALAAMRETNIVQVAEITSETNR